MCGANPAEESDVEQRGVVISKLKREQFDDHSIVVVSLCSVVFCGEAACVCVLTWLGVGGIWVAIGCINNTIYRFTLYSVYT